MKGINFEKLRRIERLKQVTLTKYATFSALCFEDYAFYSKKRAYYYERYLRLLKMKNRLLGVD